MNIIKIMATACVAAAMSSCSNYLDIKPYGKVIPETAEEFAALLNNRLNDIDEGETNWLVPNFSHTSDLDAVFGDDFEVCLTSTGGARLGTYVGSVIANNNSDSYYSNLYEIIRDCNIILSEMEERGTEQADKVIATAQAMRGACYYQLLRYFCETPRPGAFESQNGLSLVTSFDMEATPARSPMGTTVEMIENDLQAAIAANMTDDVFRFTADVARGYLCRLYFWTGQWQKALTEADGILSRHPLLDRPAYETMMQEPYDLAGNQMLKAYRSISSSGSSQISTIISTLANRPVSARFVDAFGDEKDRDIRYSLSINTKRQAKKTIFCGMRSAEFALIKAECQYHLGDQAGALATVNDLRSRRIEDCVDYKMNEIPGRNAREIITKDVTGSDLTPLMALILRERRKELFLEGDRFFELKRNGCPEFAIYFNGAKYTTRSYMYTFPIPLRDLDISPNLVQNPGYVEIVNKN